MSVLVAIAIESSQCSVQGSGSRCDVAEDKALERWTQGCKCKTGSADKLLFLRLESRLLLSYEVWIGACAVAPRLWLRSVVFHDQVEAGDCIMRARRLFER